MNLTPEFYENLTTEKLEEYAEFVDWTLVPIHLITEDLRHKFYCFPLFGTIIWFRELINSFDIRTLKSFTNRKFYFIKGKYAYMEYDTETCKLWCSDYHIWSVFTGNYKVSHEEIEEIIKKIVDRHLKIVGNSDKTFNDNGLNIKENFLKNINVLPAQDPFDGLEGTGVELELLGAIDIANY